MFSVYGGFWAGTGKSPGEPVWSCKPDSDLDTDLIILKSSPGKGRK